MGKRFATNRGFYDLEVTNRRLTLELRRGNMTADNEALKKALRQAVYQGVTWIGGFVLGYYLYMSTIPRMSILDPIYKGLPYLGIAAISLGGVLIFLAFRLRSRSWLISLVASTLSASLFFFGATTFLVTVVVIGI